MAVQDLLTLKNNMPLGTPGGTTIADIHNLIDTIGHLTTQEVATKTADYTVAAADNRKRFVFNSASAVTLTIPATIPVGWECVVIQRGAGQVTIAVTGGTLLARGTHTKTTGQYAQAYVFVISNAASNPEVALTGDTST